MSLIINQGKQDTSKDNQFEVMISDNEVAEITKIEMDKDWDNTLNITYRVISEGKYKGRMFWDRVSFDPKSQFSWKYRNLRKAAGCPYTTEEGTKVDIEALLLNKAVTVKLTARKGNDGNDYQSVTYKASNKKETETIETPTAIVEDETEEIIDSTDEEVEW